MSLRPLWNWVVRRWQETTPIKDLQYRVARLEILTRKRRAEVTLRHIDTLANLETNVSITSYIDQLRKMGRHSDVKRIAEILVALDQEEEEALKGATSERTRIEIRKVYRAKREATMRGEF